MGQIPPGKQGSQAIAAVIVLTFALLAGCDRPEPLTAKKAQEIVARVQFNAEPVYAEVPQHVWWNARSPKDDYDGKAEETLQNLARAGLITMSRKETAGGVDITSAVTEKGFPVLGTAPSMRGPVWRAQICEKRYDGIRGFERHPTIPTVGHADLVWHYANPTPWYPLFTTKINKPLDQPFASLLSFYFKDHEWKVDVVAGKVAM